MKNKLIFLAVWFLGLMIASFMLSARYYSSFEGEGRLSENSVIPDSAIPDIEECLPEDLMYLDVINDLHTRQGLNDPCTPQEILDALKSAYAEFVLHQHGLTFDQWFSQALVENKFSTTRRGSCGEYGLMQIMPSTGIWINDKWMKVPSFSLNQLNDVGLNTRFAACYMRYLLQRYDSVRVAQEAYNKGHKRRIETSYQRKIDLASRSYLGR